MKKFLLATILVGCCVISVFPQPCLPEGITFTTQAEIDNFQTNYPGCNEIEGDVTIDGEDIASLEGLIVLTSIAGTLQIGNGEFGGNPSLTNLAGLDSLTSIGGDLLILINPALSSLTGLASLSSVGEDLQIGHGDNYGYAWGNPSLTSLSGLENIEAASIGNLTIIGNISLSDCNIQSICDYLAAPFGTVNVYGNGPGCDNPQEITDACGYQINCLPFGNYYFLKQSDIDNFQSDYPGCTELEGNVTIHGTDIYDLEGLNSLTSIAGSLNLMSVSIFSLSGLDSLTSIGGDFSLKATGLNSLQTGLESLTSIGGSLILETNFDITNLWGLEGLTYIGGDLRIIEHWELSTLSGLENLNSIGGELYIFSNDELASISALEGLNTIGGDLFIIGNPILSTLTGLGNIEAASIGNLFITDNASLHTCDVEGICEYLAAPNGTVNIYDNDPGCSSVFDVAMACGGSIPCLPYGNYYFSSQTDVDNFQSVFPDCTEVQGALVLAGNSISNLEGLDPLTSIGGSFIIGSWQTGNMLTSLTGLENLTLIGEHLWAISNPVLASLTGLEGVTTIAGDIYIRSNPSLNSLGSLENLTSIEGDILIRQNTALSSLTGMDDIDPESIGNVKIYENFSLSTCHVQSICEYLTSPNGEVEIYDNAPGCDSFDEVWSSCIDFVTETGTDAEINCAILPNPLESNTLIKYSLSNKSSVLLKIFNIDGREIVTLVNEVQMQGQQKVVFNTTGLKAGAYFCVLKTGEGVQTKKMIKLIP